jgi:hypothetical protein
VRFYVLLLALLSYEASAKIILRASPEADLQRPIFAPSLYTGRAAVGLEAIGPSQAGKAASLGLQGLLKLGSLSDPRESGWVVGFRATLSENHFSPGRQLSPASQSFEGALGRASISPEFERGSGLRGFLEASFRVDKHSEADLNNEGLNEMAASIPDQTLWIGIKSGAGTDLYSEGLGTATDGRKSFLFRTFVGAYFPVKGSRLGMLNAETHTLFRCPYVDCGFLFHYDYHWGLQTRADSEEAQHLVSAGLRWEKSFPDEKERRYLLSFEALWTGLASPNESFASGWPVLRAQIFTSF